MTRHTLTCRIHTRPWVDNAIELYPPECGFRGCSVRYYTYAVLLSTVPLGIVTLVLLALGLQGTACLAVCP